MRRPALRSGTDVALMSDIIIIIIIITFGKYNPERD